MKLEGAPDTGWLAVRYGLVSQWMVHMCCDQYCCSRSGQITALYVRMGQVMLKRVLCHIRTTEAQISLRIRAV